MLAALDFYYFYSYAFTFDTLYCIFVTIKSTNPAVKNDSAIQFSVDMHERVNHWFNITQLK